jgi:hypothetical protein
MTALSRRHVLAGTATMAAAALPAVAVAQTLEEQGVELLQRLVENLHGNGWWAIPGHQMRYTGLFWERGSSVSMQVRLGEETITIHYSDCTWPGGVCGIDRLGFTVNDIVRRSGLKIGRVIDNRSAAGWRTWVQGGRDA